MAEHYTKLTVSACAWCARCRKQTGHRVDKGRIGPCMRCIERLQIEHAYNEIEQRRQRRQGNLFPEMQCPGSAP